MAPVDRVGDLSAYEAVVLGSAIYIGRWRKEMVRFLKANEQALAERKAWLFSSGPTGEGDPPELIDGREVPEMLRPIVDRVQPQDVVVLHGAIDADDLNFLERFAVKNVGAPLGDFRDWEAIAAWAEDIADVLKSS